MFSKAAVEMKCVSFSKICKTFDVFRIRLDPVPVYPLGLPV